MKCRHCKADLSFTFIDLGSSPPSNAYLTKESLSEKELEKWYPLKVMVCGSCWLVQTEDFVGVSEMFSEDYAYFSSVSNSWLEHAKIYVDKVVSLFELTSASVVVEVAANDGYLLQYIKDKGIACYGIEPTHNTAESARDRGIEIVEDFFGVSLAEELVAQGRQADLLVANNVLAHVPDINDFVKGFSLLLKESGVATFEFPHLLNLVEKNQFDTIYHEHYSYLSLTSVHTILKANGLMIFDVEEIATHGGSLRVYTQLVDTGIHQSTHSVAALLERERSKGITNLDYYAEFQNKADQVKDDFLSFLKKAKQARKSVVGYGAAAKGNTLLNYAGVSTEFIDYVVDRNTAKQNKLLPGSHIPVLDEARLRITKPAYVVIFPWNLQAELFDQLSYIRQWGGQFVTTIPELKVA